MPSLRLIIWGALCVLTFENARGDSLSTVGPGQSPEPPPAAAAEETALTIPLRPVPRAMVEMNRGNLAAARDRLLEERKALNADLDSYFATYGDKVGEDSPLYPDFIKKRGEIMEANDRLLTKMKAYNRATILAIKERIAQLDAEIKQTKKNLLTMQKSFSNESGAFEDLADLGEKERDALLDSLRDHAIEASFEAGEAGVEKTLEKAATINAKNAQKIIAQLQRAGADNPDLLQLIKTIGDTKNKKARLEEGKRLYKMLKNEKTIWKLNELGGKEEYLAALIEVISWVSPSPWLKVCAEGLFDSAKADLTVWCVLSPTEAEMTNSTEDQLRQLKQVGDHYVLLIKQRKEAREELRELPVKTLEELGIKG